MVAFDVISEEIFTAFISGSDEDVEQSHLAHLEVMQHLAELTRVASRPQEESYLVVISLFALAPVYPRCYY